MTTGKDPADREPMRGGVAVWVVVGAVKGLLLAALMVGAFVLFGYVFGVGAFATDWRDTTRDLGILSGVSFALASAHGAAISGGRILGGLSGLLWGVLAGIGLNIVSEALANNPFVYVGMLELTTLVGASTEARLRGRITRPGLIVGLICWLLLGAWLFLGSKLLNLGSDAAQTNLPAARKPQAAPPFMLPDLEGKPVRLGDFEGRVVLISFWATWCRPCLMELPHVEKLHRKLAAQGFSVVALNTDRDSGMVREFVAQSGYTFPVLLADQSVQLNYNVYGLPFAVLVDRKGHIRSRRAGYSPGQEWDMESEVTALLREQPNS